MRIPKIGRECLAAIPYAAVVLPHLIEARIAGDMVALGRTLGMKAFPPSESVADCEKALTAFIARKSGRWVKEDSLVLDVRHRYGYIWHKIEVVVVVAQYSVFEARHLAALKETHPDKYEVANLLLRALYFCGRMPVMTGGDLLDYSWDGFEIEEIVEESGMEEEYVTSLYKERELIGHELAGLPREVTLDAILAQVKEMLKKPLRFTRAQRKWITNSVALLSLQQKERKDHLVADLEKECALEFEDVMDPATFFMVLWDVNGPLGDEYAGHLESYSSGGVDVPCLGFRIEDAQGLKAIDRLCRMFHLLQEIFWRGGDEWKED